MTPRGHTNTLTIYAVSDATGETVESVAFAALVQFRNPRTTIEWRGQVRTVKQVRAAAQHHGVEALDLLGPLLQRLMVRLKKKPMRRPGVFKHLARGHPREIEAVEFAVRHDDGRLTESLDKAEIVLVGVSRKMKTPITLYLAYRGWLVANMPIHPELQLPHALRVLPPDRVFCLLMAPARLQEIRASRASAMNMPLEPYASLEHIRHELLQPSSSPWITAGAGSTSAGSRSRRCSRDRAPARDRGGRAQAHEVRGWRAPRPPLPRLHPRTRRTVRGQSPGRLLRIPPFQFLLQDIARRPAASA